MCKLLWNFTEEQRSLVAYLLHGSQSSYSTALLLCPGPLEIDHGMVNFTGNSVGDNATYTCDSGFELIGDAMSTCTQMDANFAAFQPTPPVCRRKYNLNDHNNKLFEMAACNCSGCTHTSV